MAIIYGSAWKSIASTPGIGVTLKSESKVVGERRGGGPRGTVKGWSLASRRRFRRWMIEHEVCPEFLMFGVTLTIPGPSLPIATAKRIFEAFRTSLKHWGWGMLWRLETQKRGQAHWHGIIAVRPETHPWWKPEHDQGEDGDKTRAGVTFIKLAWLNALDSIGPQEYLEPVVVGRELVRSVPGLSWWPGADAWAVKVETGDQVNRRWLWYLQDHATKRKQEQVPEGWGRHWGVVGRACWKKATRQTQRVFEADWMSVRRWLSRMLTPSVKDERCPFKRRSGRKYRINVHGSTDIFCNPETVQRMIEQARKNYRDKHGFDPSILVSE